MTGFNSIDDWASIHGSFYRSIQGINDPLNKLQLLKMLGNIRVSVSTLSKVSVIARQSRSSWEYQEALLKVQRELQELDQWVTFAMLVDKE